MTLALTISGASAATVHTVQGTSSKSTQSSKSREVFVTMEEIKEVVSRHCSKDPSEINDRDKFATDLGMDEYDIQDLFQDIESTFDVMILDYYFDRIRTPEDLYNYVREY